MWRWFIETGVSPFAVSVFAFNSCKAVELFFAAKPIAVAKVTR
jgi:hypothetical protein